jgi:hypothetical protein
MSSANRDNSHPLWGVEKSNTMTYMFEEEGDTNWWHSFVVDAFSNLSKIPSIHALHTPWIYVERLLLLGS